MTELRNSLTTLPEAQTAQRVKGFGATVFAEFTALADRHGAVNLGQGFPNFPAPEFIKQAAQDAIARDLNQYTRSAGHPRLVEALAAKYSPLFARAIDPAREVVVTTGATEAIFASVQALVNPEDEVILVEPFYDSYPASVTMAGGIPVFVPLRAEERAGSASEWHLSIDELRSAISPRTRLLILNTPMNPVGKVFSHSVLLQISALAVEHDLLVLSDEVYEWMVYGGEHVRITTLPGMAERTITVGSAGKTFGVTGWKIGWAIAPPTIAHAILMAHQWIPFAVATPFQEAVAIGFEQADANGYFATMPAMYKCKRDMLVSALDAAGLNPVVPDGSYFVLVDTGRIPVQVESGQRRDIAVCRWLTTQIGVAAIPLSPFYCAQHQSLSDSLARFCFCKTDAMLEEAASRLQRIAAFM